ncbi:MAG TPA: hypothetical protein PLR23_02405, partial [Candidatus Cloacimonas acidaminovorans]|nr:hypothetical protein [Candidatus Cloacimonas acidaminovorans]
PEGRYNDSEGGVSPSLKNGKTLSALRSLLFAKKPEGRNYDVEGGVSPSEERSPEFFLFSFPFFKKPLRATQ